jgi:glycosyltransferase involved in cell wall biosynthesis
VRRAGLAPAPPTLADYEALERRRSAGDAEAPVVSVVTVVRNAVLTLPRTIASVQAQSGPSVEHVIVDGGSEDGSLDVIRRLLRPQDYWMSEPDRGISDAFNKGIALARGRYIQILNADDWLTPGQMNTSAGALAASTADFVFGDCLAFDGERPVFRYRGDPNYAALLHRRMHAMNHPSMLVRRSAYAEHGLFALQFRNSMDYEWLLRAHRRGARGIYDPRITTNFSLGGVTFREARRAMSEVRDISVAYGRSPVAATLEYRYHLSKGAVAYRLKQRARPIYERVRAWINPSFEPLTPTGR